MSVSIQLSDDEALVLFDLLASRRLEQYIEGPERNALWALEALLQKQLAAPFASDYAEQLASARDALVARYGD